MEWGNRPLSRAAQKAHPRPTIPYAASVYLQAFKDLENDRFNAGQGIAGITFTSKLTYAQQFGHNVDEFLDVMNDVDAVFVNKVNSNLNKKAENGSANT